MAVPFVILTAAGGVIAAVLGFTQLSQDVDRAGRLTGIGPFQRMDLGETLDPFALGAADFDGDAVVDLFSSNHNLAERYFRNLGGLSFSETRADLGLSSNADFPDAEPADELPELDAPGLYIFWKAGRLEIVQHGQVRQTQLHLTLRLTAGILPQAKGGARILRDETMNPGAATDHANALVSELDLSFVGDGRVSIGSLERGINGLVDLDPDADLASVYVGRRRVNPKEARFVLRTGDDRHGAAWTDFDQDGKTDVLMVLGGEVGTALAPEPYPVYLGTASGFTGPQAVQGVMQEFCPARQVRLGDADGDGQDDIMVVCGRATPPRADHPNEVFVRTGPAQFENRAAALGLDLPGRGFVRWFDTGDGSPLQLLWADDHSITVLARRGSRYEPVFAASSPGVRSQIAAGDLDGDGSPEFFIGNAAGESVLLTRSGGSWRLSDPTEIGLPSTALCAAFVDQDNDGTLEFHALPSGLYSREGERFVATGQLVTEAREAHCLWLDANQDGFHDLFVALPLVPLPLPRLASKIRRTYEGFRYRGQHLGRVYRPDRWTLALYHATPSDGHWLTVALAGPSGNPSGLGATVVVTAGDRQIARQIALADGSTTSHGLFDVHFGLGEIDAVDSITVNWSDGTTQLLEDVPLDQHLRIAYRAVGRSQSAAAP